MTLINEVRLENYEARNVDGHMQCKLSLSLILLIFGGRKSC